MTSLRANRLVWTVLAPFVAFVGVLIGTAFLSAAPVNWDQWRAATCMPGACFCEAVRGGTVRQVANTWSSFAFVFVALWVVGVARFDRVRGLYDIGLNASQSVGAVSGNSLKASWIRPSSNAMRQRTVYPLLLALALFVVGVGSAFYHASLTFAGQFADVFGMYLIGTFVLLYNVGRLRPMSDVTAITSYVALNVGLAGLLYSIPELRRYAFAMLIVAALFVEYRVRRRGLVNADARYLIGAVGALAVAFVVWALDLRRVVCTPESLWQGHAVWHVLGAVACAELYVFYRSESTGPEV